MLEIEIEIGIEIEIEPRWHCQAASRRLNSKAGCCFPQFCSVALPTSSSSWRPTYKLERTFQHNFPSFLPSFLSSCRPASLPSCLFHFLVRTRRFLCDISQQRPQPSDIPIHIPFLFTLTSTSTSTSTPILKHQPLTPSQQPAAAPSAGVQSERHRFGLVHFDPTGARQHLAPLLLLLRLVSSFPLWLAG